MRALKKLLLVSLPTLLVSFAVVEFVILRFWVPVDDVPREEYDGGNQVIRYRPNQTGISYPDRDLHHPVPFTINADGWNSFHPHYDVARGSKLRVAVIGDSYVAALEVAPRSSIAGQLETLLGQDHAEVYAFGIRGAPLSEYLQIARYVVAKYRPDAVVIVIVHNDFDESYRTIQGRYTPSFLHLDVDHGEVKELPPQPYEESGLQAWVRTRSYTFRFVFYRLQVGSQQLRSLYSSVFNRSRRFEANVDTASLAGEEPRMHKVASYVFDQFARLERSSGARFVLVMDTPRAAIYEERDPRKSEAYRMNRVAEQESAAAGLRFIDLTPFFESDYRDHRTRFEFPHDGHWNARAHGLAAGVACRALAMQLRERRMQCQADRLEGSPQEKP